MSHSYFEVNIGQLKARLQVEESGKAFEYVIELAPDRSDALIERKAVDGSGATSALLTLDQLCGHKPHDVEWARASHVVWAARGLWGIPLELTPRDPEFKLPSVEEIVAEMGAADFPGETVSL